MIAKINDLKVLSEIYITNQLCQNIQWLSGAIRYQRNPSEIGIKLARHRIKFCKLFNLPFVK